MQREAPVGDNLEIVLQQYKTECNIISAALKASTSNIHIINRSEIGKIIDGLYSLKNVGPMLKQLEDNSDDAEKVNETFMLSQSIDLSDFVKDFDNQIPLYSILKERNGG